MSDRSQIDEIKDRLDIVEVAQSYLHTPFKKSGRNTFTLCPFHNEKTPSFSLNSELGIYKCFGCGESGDVINFIEKMEGVDFPEALEIAAAKAGIILKKTFSQRDQKLIDERKKIIEVNNLVAEYYHHLLVNHKAGEFARNYCKKRKLRRQEIKLFRIGYAPKGFENLKRYLLNKGYKLTDLINYGLLVSKGKNVYDKFRNRLMFPIENHRGEVVGFSGRTLVPDGIPKYLNSPETPVYKKSEIIFGLYHARDSIRKQNFAIIAEGNMEPLSSRRVDIENVVVPLGTSLTEQQLKMLRRYCDNLYFAFDTDDAGQAALLRAIKLAIKQGFSLKVINLGNYQDPDEMIANDPKLWPKQIENAVDVIDYLINQYREKYDLNSASGKSAYLKFLIPYIKSLSDPVQLEFYVKKLSEILDISQLTIAKYIDNYDLKALDDFHTEKQTEDKYRENISKEEFLLALILQFPNIKFEYSEKIFSDKLINIVHKVQKDPSCIRDELTDYDKKIFDKLIMFDLSALVNEEYRVRKEFERIKELLSKELLRSKLKKLEEKIKLYEKQGKDTESLLIKVEKISKTLKLY